MPTPHNEIDWDLIVYDYDSATGEITVLNFEPQPLLIARAVRDTAPVETFAHRLINAANERLAQDQLAREIQTRKKPNE